MIIVNIKVKGQKKLIIYKLKCKKKLLTKKIQEFKSLK